MAEDTAAASSRTKKAPAKKSATKAPTENGGQVEMKEVQAAPKMQNQSNAMLPPIHHIVRTLTTGSPPATGGGNRPVGVDELDSTLSSWLDNGYILAHVQVLGVGDLNGAFIARILYVVVKREYAVMAGGHVNGNGGA